MTGPASGPASGTESEGQPVLLRVLDPDATPEEVAAIVAVFASLGGGEPAPAPPRSEWANPARGMRRAHPHGPGAWRASGLPR